MTAITSGSNAYSSGDILFRRYCCSQIRMVKLSTKTTAELAELINTSFLLISIPDTAYLLVVEETIRV